jgi:hypothetical protein
VTARQLVALSLAGVAAAAPLAPAQAAPKKPVSKTYSMALAPLPVPAQGTPTCLPADGQEGVTKHTETLKVSGPGQLKVEVSGFYGDWDITVFDEKGRAVGVGSGTSTPGTGTSTGVDKASTKIKKASTLKIVTCNFAGSPSATGKYTFTYTK